MLNKINSVGDDFLFHRQTTLRLLNKCACVSGSDSERSFDENDVLNDFAESYLLVNELLAQGSSTLTGNSGKKQLLVETIPMMEYAVNSSPAYETKKLFVRGEEYLRLLQENASELNVNEIFLQATGLTLEHYQRLIFGMFAFYWNFTSEEICRQDPIRGKSLLFNPIGQSPELTPLYEKLLQHISISIDQLRDRVEERPQFENEFRLWRKYPILKISEDRIICVDFSFLLEKLQTGVFWTIRDCLRDNRRERGIFEDLWGDVFENYASSIIKRGINSQNPSNREKFIINPTYDKKQRLECADIAICSDDALVLMECKATILSAPAKFSGDFNIFYDNIKSVKKGIKQLSDAIRRLAALSQSRDVVKEIDICKVKKIYPVLVVSDGIFSAPLMNWFLNSEFNPMVRRNSLMKHLKVMPLTVLTIMDLESLEPFMKDKPFHAYLDEWLNQFQDQDALAFRSYLYPLMMRDDREHNFMDQEFARIESRIQNYYSSHGIN
jgi:hypothetical protein